MSATILPIADPLLSTGRAAKRAGLGKTKLLALVRQGRIRVLMLDRRVFIRASWIDEFLDDLPEGYVKGARPPLRRTAP